MVMRRLYIVTGSPSTGKSTIELNLRLAITGTILSYQPYLETSKCMFIGPVIGMQGRILQTMGFEYHVYHKNILWPSKEVLERTNNIFIVVAPGYYDKDKLNALFQWANVIHEYQLYADKEQHTALANTRTNFFSGRNAIRKISKAKICSVVTPYYVACSYAHSYSITELKSLFYHLCSMIEVKTTNEYKKLEEIYANVNCMPYLSKRIQVRLTNKEPSSIRLDLKKIAYTLTGELK